MEDIVQLYINIPCLIFHARRKAMASMKRPASYKVLRFSRIVFRQDKAADADAPAEDSI